MATVTPLPSVPGSNAKFGATIAGVDLNQLSDADFEIIRNAIYVHKVVVVKGQHNLIPAKQFDFVHRLDPAADRVQGFDTEDVTDETSGVLGVCRFYSAGK
jgi:alpha-ketoglutarate-dependent taurine dioxygenase